MGEVVATDEFRDWYRGLTAIDQAVIPVVKPEGFLTPDELFQLDAAMQPATTPTGDFGNAAAAAIAGNDPFGIGVSETSDSALNASPIQ